MIGEKFQKEAERIGNIMFCRAGAVVYFGIGGFMGVLAVILWMGDVDRLTCIAAGFLSLSLFVWAIVRGWKDSLKWVRCPSCGGRVEINDENGSYWMRCAECRESANTGYRSSRGAA